MKSLSAIRILRGLQLSFIHIIVGQEFGFCGCFFFFLLFLFRWFDIGVFPALLLLFWSLLSSTLWFRCFLISRCVRWLLFIFLFILFWLWRSFFFFLWLHQIFSNFWNRALTDVIISAFWAEVGQLRYFQLWNVQLRFIVTFTLAGWFRRCLFSSPTFASGYVFGIVGLSLFFFSLLFLFPFFESFSFELFLFVFSFLFKFFLDFFASICPVKFEQFAYIAFVGVEKAIHSLRVGCTILMYAVD